MSSNVMFSIKVPIEINLEAFKSNFIKEFAINVKHLEKSEGDSLKPQPGDDMPFTFEMDDVYWSTNYTDQYDAKNTALKEL